MNELGYLQCRFWVEFNEAEVTEVGLEEIILPSSVYSQWTVCSCGILPWLFVFSAFGAHTALNLSPNICLPLCYKIRGESVSRQSVR